VESIGGLDGVEKRNGRKASLLYDVIDENPDFYLSRVEKESRSFMNVTFNLSSEDLEAKFIAEAKAEGIIGIKGHRSVGGIRVSNYNSHDEKDTEAVASFMKRFIEKNG
jgi:phosphoserine aminotransferase